MQCDVVHPVHLHIVYACVSLTCVAGYILFCRMVNLGEDVFLSEWVYWAYLIIVAVGSKHSNIHLHCTCVNNI